MKANINIVKIAGRIAKDVHLSCTNKNVKQVGNMVLALDVSGGQTLFVDITAWEDTADILGKLFKGDIVLVEGRLDLNYKDPKKIIITADKIKLLHSKWFDKLGRDNKELEDLFAMHEIDKLMKE
jgi:hypothetical protein